jgi:hypothetical protein
MRAFILAAALALSTNVLAQALETQTFPQSQIPPALEVQRLAPQLVAFAGGDANFQNLVNGLATGAAVTLADGTQVVSFTPGSAMNALQIAQTLEKVRQSLIGRGIATPTAQQLAIILTGGSLPTALGTTPVTGVVPASTPITTSTAVQQSPAAAIQKGMSPAAAGGTPAVRSNVSDSPFPRGISDTPAPSVPGAAAAAGSAAAFGAPPAATVTVAPATTAPAGTASLRTR